MKKAIKKSVSLLLVVILMTISSVLPAYAVGETNAEPVDSSKNVSVMPRFMHCSKCVMTFTVSAPGTAYVGVTYNAYSDTFLEAKVTVKIQKRVLGVFWKTVDIGYANDEWVDYSEAVNGYFYNSFAISGTGTYRANFTVEITGKDGSCDVIEDTIERKYS